MRFAIAIALNVAIVVIEIVFGYRAGSMGLLSDAFHNVSDVAALFVAFAAYRYSLKSATEKMTYGYVRAEMMGGFVNSLFLFAAMAYVIFESVRKLVAPEPVQGATMMIVAGAAAAINAFSVWILSKTDFAHSHAEHSEHGGHEHEHSEHGHEKRDLNTRAAILHLASDVGISLCVVAGGLAVKLTGFVRIDPALSIGFALYILYHAAKIFREAFRSLMDYQSGSLRAIVASVVKIEGVLSVHDAHFTEPSSKEKYFTAHVVVDSSMTICEFDELAERIRENLKRFDITHSVLQPETSKYESGDILCCRH